jgi:hypothetical protein
MTASLLSREKDLTMRFRLRTLLALCTLVAVFCALFFAAPIYVELPVLALIVLIAPSVWICGACFGRGAWRPFFLGGICAGWLPHLILVYYALAAGLSEGLSSFTETSSEEFNLITRFAIAGLFLFSGVVAAIGGSCGVLVYRWCGTERCQAAPEEPAGVHQQSRAA